MGKEYTDVSNLIVGQTYKYPQLCEILGEKATGGNQKKAQLKRWQRYFMWSVPINEKTGKKTTLYKIESIYEEPIPRIIQRKSIYDLTDIILLLIGSYPFGRYNSEDTNDYAIGITKSKFNELVGFCNKEYKKLQRMSTKDMELPYIPEATKQDFFNTTKDTFESIIRTNLNKLQEKNILSWSESHMWYFYAPNKQGITVRQYRLATDTEESVINWARYKARTEWNAKSDIKLNNYAEVYFRLVNVDRQWVEDRVVELIREQTRTDMSGYCGSSRCYKLIVNDSTITQEFEVRGLDTQNMTDILRQLTLEMNEQMTHTVIQRNRKKLEKAQKNVEKLQLQLSTVPDRNEGEVGFGKDATAIVKGVDKIRTSDAYYVENCDTLAGIVIPLNNSKA